MQIFINKKNNSQSGFSIIEMIITIFIFTLIGIILVNFQLDIFSLNRISNNNLLAQKEAQQALKVMSTEIRSMSPSNREAYPIIQASTSTLIFYNDVTGDDRKERIRYFLDDSTLKKGVTEPNGNSDTYSPQKEVVQDLVYNIVNNTVAIFSYYDTNYDGTLPSLTLPVNIDSIRLIKIDLVINNDSLKSPPPLSQTTTVAIRILKDNL
jgi:type II secretory pathway pseudopilin PulG